MTELTPFAGSITEGPLSLRPARPGDAEAVGRIVYVAFRRINESRGFAPDFPSVEAAVGFAKAMIGNPAVFGVAAVAGGRIVGSNFLSERDPIRGVGPITVDPDHQGAGVGRRLMQAVIERGASGRGVRLVQGTFNTVSLSLYASLGFEVREPLVVMAGHPRDRPGQRVSVEAMRTEDVAEADALCRRVHGFSRGADIADAVDAGTAVALRRSGRLAGYMTAPGFWIGNHAVAECQADLRDLILGAGADDRPLAFLLPIRSGALFRWALAQGFRVVMPMTLMTRGAYAEPAGAWLPSVFY
jgi:GNAT superfamily N-acetyltransferase